MTEEKIFILARMGNTREALQLITEQGSNKITKLLILDQFFMITRLF